MAEERYWDDAEIGDEGVSPTVTVTGEIIDTYADVSGDHTLLHIDEEYARKSHFGQRVAHGLYGLAVADGLKCQSEYRFLPGMSLGWTWDFLQPIRIGDILHVKFRISAKRPSKSKPGWGIVTIPCELINQKGEVVQRGEHKLMLPCRPVVRTPEPVDKPLVPDQVSAPAVAHARTKPAQMPPLTGIRVIDYSHFLAGPYLSRCLAGLGAEVIKVERPTEGDAGRTHAYLIDGVSGYFLQQNMGKKGLCVNIKDPRGRELMHKLAATADVFVENYRPGSLSKLGLGYEELAKINPRLVYCSVSAFGHTGPDSLRPGFGAIAEARSGAMAQLGMPGEPPPLLRMPIADNYTGIHGVAAICAALLGRVTTNKGQHIDMALFDCMVAMHDYAVQCYTLSGGKEIPVPTGSDLPQSTVYGTFPARDGYLVIVAQMDDSWKRLARLIGGDALAADARFHSTEGRNAHNKEALSLVREWTMAQPSVKACIAALDAVDVACSPVQRIDEVLADPQTRARNLIIEQEHPVLGRIQLPNLPFRFSDCDTAPRGIAPTIGQHNREIATQLGYPEGEIDALVAGGVLYAGPAALKP